MVSNTIRTEADDILRSGLQTMLGRHGFVHIVGSHALGLMTWRDLDIHVVREDLDVRVFFDLGGEIARLLKPHRMHFRDESTVGTPGLPREYYWGVYLGDERSGAWKIDIWQTNRQAFNVVRRFGDDLSARLNDANRAVILEIKAACWHHPQYRRGFTSADVYAAVLDRGVRDVPGFGRTFARRRASRNGPPDISQLHRATHPDWKRFRRWVHRRLTYRSPQLIAHGIPKRSTTAPNRCAQKVCPRGNVTRPPSASCVKMRSAVAASSRLS
jgi:hypothetical protein